jgi:hypothetical protein
MSTLALMFLSFVLPRDTQLSSKTQIQIWIYLLRVLTLCNCPLILYRRHFQLSTKFAVGILARLSTCDIYFVHIALLTEFLQSDLQQSVSVFEPHTFRVNFHPSP